MATRFAGTGFLEAVRAGSSVALAGCDDGGAGDTVIDGAGPDDLPIDVDIEIEAELQLDVDLS
jgi:hypothetical protein